MTAEVLVALVLDSPEALWILKGRLGDGPGRVSVAGPWEHNGDVSKRPTDPSENLVTECCEVVDTHVAWSETPFYVRVYLPLFRTEERSCATREEGMAWCDERLAASGVRLWNGKKE